MCSGICSSTSSAAHDFSASEAEQQFDTLVDWGRYAQLFDYHADEERLYLDREATRWLTRLLFPSGGLIPLNLCLSASESVVKTSCHQHTI